MREDSITNNYDVIILGAGAAGLFAAIHAAKRGKKVIVLEKSNKAGKKILMSGGGYCNFTNKIVTADNFISANPHFCKAALGRFTPDDFINILKQYNIPYETRQSNQLFCCNKAKDIVNLLLNLCDKYGVKIILNCEVTTVRHNVNESHRFIVEAKAVQKLRITAWSLIVATGALSIPSLGGSDFGYKLARDFSLDVLPTRAGLVPFVFSDKYQKIFASLSGVSVFAQVSCNKSIFNANILFTHRGLSGPAILQISNYWNSGDNITINMLPNTCAAKLLLEAKQKYGSKKINTILASLLPNAVVVELAKLWWSTYDNQVIAEVSNKNLLDIIK